MARARLRSAVVCLALTAACGGTPTSPPAVVSAAPLKVVVSVPVGHRLALTPGERMSLTALRIGDGVSGECTSSATWTSSNDAIARFTGNELLGVTSGDVSVFAVCDGVKSEALALNVGAGLIIGGLERYAFLLPGDTGYDGTQALLRAYQTAADGSRGAECTTSAEWWVGDTSIALIGGDRRSDYPTAGLGSFLEGVGVGTTIVNARCGAAVGQAVVTVRRLPISGVVRDVAGQPVSGATVLVTPEYDYRPSPYSKQVTTAADGSYSLEWNLAYAYVKVTKPGSNPYLNRLSWQGEPSLSANALLATIRPVFSATGTICSTGATGPECGSAFRDYVQYFFRTGTSGETRIHVTWPGEGGGPLTHGLVTRLTCGATTVINTLDLSGAIDLTFNANGQCEYALILSNAHTIPIIPFRLTIEQ